MIKSPISSLKRASLAIEDLLYAIQKVRPEQLKDALSVINVAINASETQSNSAVAKSYESNDPNKRFLIGALPRLLLDLDMFPTNDDIVDFAAEALHLKMTPTAKKRARYELIGKLFVKQIH